MNYIHSLRKQNAVLDAASHQLLTDLHNLKWYLTSDKFTTASGELTGCVNVKDVLLRLKEAQDRYFDILTGAEPIEPVHPPVESHST